ncbi:hypothetical protein QE381_003351 [Microbacterium sp. SORGH_AS 888]|nr:hypothetical protein [Microbacterium sp. SORGH_AS_0888]MDQ1131223.1 hypothetical protein [Microbacterium sp. SORGH_AS_0888]
MLTVVERRYAFFSSGRTDALATTEFVVAAEQDRRGSYVYLGALEDVGRFFALTRDSARLLHSALGAALTSME